MFRLPKKFAVRYAEVMSQAVENVQRGVAKLALDLAEVSPVDFGISGQPFLRYPSLGPEAAKVPS